MFSLWSTELTTIVAFYGAIVSSIVFLWNIRKDLRDRGYLSLKLNSEITLAGTESGFQQQPKKTTLTVVNRGRRACTIQAVGFISNPTIVGNFRRRWFGNNILNSENLIPLRCKTENNEILPKRLDYEEIWTGCCDWKNFYLVPYGEKITFYVEDTLGRQTFTKRFSVDLFKDPNFENEDELPYILDDEFRKSLRPPSKA